MDTGPDFSEKRILADGTIVTLRHIRPEDADELKRGFAKLSPESRFRRFLGAVTELSDEKLRYLTCVDGVDHVAIVATTRPPGAEADVGLGVARFVRLPGEPTVAEAAITVLDDVQGKGIGKLLAMTLARAAWERGVLRFSGEILANNDRVRALLTEVGADIRHVDGTIRFEVGLQPPDARLEVVARRLLRAASSFLAGLFAASAL